MALIEPNTLLVLVVRATDRGWMGTVMKQGNGASTWVYLLRELDSEHTRLIVRWRMCWKPTFKTPVLVLIRLLLAPIEFVMERKMLLGIKKRTERASRQTPEPIGITGSSMPRPSEVVAQEKQDATEEKMPWNAWASLTREPAVSGNEFG